MTMCYSSKDRLYFNDALICTVGVYNPSENPNWFVVSAKLVNSDFVRLYESGNFEECKEFLAMFIKKMNQKGDSK